MSDIEDDDDPEEDDHHGAAALGIVLDEDVPPPAPAPPQVEVADPNVFDLSTASIEEKLAKLIEPLSATESNLESYFEIWYHVFRDEFKMGEHNRNMHHVCNIYDCHERSSIDRVEQKYKLYLERFRSLIMMMLQEDLLGMSSDEKRVRMERISELQKNIYRSYRQAISMFQLENPTGPSISGRLRVEDGLLDYEPVDLSQMNEFQYLLQQLLELAGSKGLGKIGMDVYEPIITPEGHHTHAWKYLCDMETFVHEAAYPFYVNFKLWLNLYKNPGNGRKVAGELAKIHDDRFPNVNRDRHVFAFRNGLYVAPQDFIPTDDKPTYTANGFYVDGTPAYRQNIPSKLDAAKYFDLEFKSDEWTKMCEAREDGWKDIPTPVIDLIAGTQRWDKEEGVLEWLYIMIGRMIYEVREFDNWQVMPVFKGLAGTGKSSLLEEIGMIYDPQDVAAIENRVERNFSLEGTVNRNIYLITDVKADFQLDQTAFNKMVSGEKISVSRKNKTPIPVIWVMPGAMACNVFPNWNNNGNNLARRVVLFLCLHSVLNGNTRLPEQMKLEIAALIKKSNYLYLRATRRYKEPTLDKILPIYFVQTRLRIQRDITPIINVLDSSYIVYNKKYYLDWESFVVTANAFCKSQRIGIKQNEIQENMFMDAFRSRGIELYKQAVWTKLPDIHNPEPTLTTSKQRGTCIVGLTVPSYEALFRTRQQDYVCDELPDDSMTTKRIETSAASSSSASASSSSASASSSSGR